MKPLDHSTDPQFIFRQLKLGLGHELVNDENVTELIALAQRDGHTLIEKELREWHKPARARDEGPPSTIPPTPGFNKSHVRH